MSDPARLMRFVLELRRAGVTDARVLAALERTPRTHYAPAHLEGLAMEDVALPLAHTQFMTKPSLVGRMIIALAPQSGDAVLEVGSGSGYQGAVIADLAQKVVTLDRWSDLVHNARARFNADRQTRIHAHLADGFDGFEDEAPYDRIIVNAAVKDLPPPLLDQLKAGGVLLAPVGDARNQRLIRYHNGAREDLGPIRLQPLERGLGDASPVPGG